MNHWQKLGLPIALGICAAFLNWQSVSRKLEPRDYVALSGNIKPGEQFSASSFKKIRISHTASANLQNVLIPWSHKDALIGRFAQRTIGRDDLLTRFDMYEANVATIASSEEYLFAQQRTTPTYFVNDAVSVRDNEGRMADGCRILAIIPEKDGYKIRLAMDSQRLKQLKSKGLLNTEKLEVR